MTLTTLAGSALRAGPAFWRRGANRRHQHRTVTLLPRLLRELGETAESWVAGPVFVSNTRTAVVPLGPRDHEPVAMAKLPGTAAGAASQEREGRALAALSAQPIGDFARLLPLRMGDGRVAGTPYVLERAIPGITADTADPGSLALATDAAATIAVLHSRTARSSIVDDALLRHWVDDRVDILARATRKHASAQRLRTRMHAAWAGRRVEIGWVHGDFWLGNVLLEPRTRAVAGIVDWEWAVPDELPAQDIYFACVHSRKQADRLELGDVIADLLTHPTWTPAERALHKAAGAPVGPRADPDVLLLVWLRQIEANLTQTPGLAYNPLWILRNITCVLRAADASDPGWSQAAGLRPARL